MKSVDVVMQCIGFLALWTAGGERTEDFDQFRQDAALAELIGHGAFQAAFGAFKDGSAATVRAAVQASRGPNSAICSAATQRADQAGHGGMAAPE